MVVNLKKNKFKGIEMIKYFKRVFGLIFISSVYIIISIFIILASPIFSIKEDSFKDILEKVFNVK